jgi:DNA modification methylase
MTNIATVYHGNCIDKLKSISDCSIDSVVTDPPYSLSNEISILKEEWDSTGIAFDVELWKECYRVLKPGGHVIAFGFPRLYHHLAIAIEKSGFEIRDCLVWIYKNGFPKSHNISKAIDKINGVKLEDKFALGKYIKSQRVKLGYTVDDVNSWVESTSKCQHWESRNSNNIRVPTKEDYEIIKPKLELNNDWDDLIMRVEAERDVQTDEHGQVIYKTLTTSKHLHMPLQDSKKVKVAMTANATENAKKFDGWGTGLKPSHNPIVLARKPMVTTIAENMITHGVGAINIKSCMIKDKWPANIIVDDFVSKSIENNSSFFFVPRASASEKNLGIMCNFKKANDVYTISESMINFFDHSNTTIKNGHTTVKPIELMRHLVRLVTPDGGIVLDPFLGSGTTGCAAILESKSFVGVELNENYIQTAMARMYYWYYINKAQMSMWS